VPKDKATDPYSAALRMLSCRGYSVAELRRALEKRFPASPAVEDAIVRLRSLGYLNDKKFAEHYASSLVRNKALGRFRVRRELKAKLVDYRHIEHAVEQAFEETDERKMLERVLDRKVRTLKRPITPARLHSLYQSLLRRGFAADAIMKAVRSRPELKPVADDANVEDLEAEKL
jgi:regulatory protein